MMARIPTYIFALIELVVMLHVLFHRLANRMVLVIVHDVSICDVLRVYTTTPFD